ncbi:CRISPR-associated protein Cas6/Cse3/CasE [Leptospira ryugenii]|uniref:CRISPR-associated protein Cas6/Cse3/CasE n=2 Tax=Leptospira ryugenii TaxID=1917863 RepID=A0A2P2E1J4_9LEPT|nr:CRISPR-associated protein Cas6/Cse3/CasE [Leptospira ryugenii]
MGFEKQKSESMNPDFLYRVEENFKQAGEPKPRILVLSNVSPLWDNAFNGEEFLKGKPQILNLNLDNFIEEDRSFRFSLKANPTKKIKNYRLLFKEELKDFPEKESREYREKYREGKLKLEKLIQTISKEQREKLPSKRVGIYKDYEQVDWLKRKGELSGFEILNLQFDKGEKEKVSKKKNMKILHELDLLQVHFTGILRVTNTEAFKKAYTQGIGSGKAFGCGMLMLAPA